MHGEDERRDETALKRTCFALGSVRPGEVLVFSRQKKGRISGKKITTLQFEITLILNTMRRNVFYRLRTNKENIDKKAKKKPYPKNRIRFLVEATGLEPTTSWSLTKRATKLRYASISPLKRAQRK